MKAPAPYAQFWCCDLQTHSPFEPEFTPGVSKEQDGPIATAAAKFVDAAVERGLDAVAITDHNSVAFVDALTAAAAGRLIVFPGVELSAADGYHLLAIFEPGTTPARIQEFLAKIGIQKGKERTAPKSLGLGERSWMSFTDVATRSPSLRTSVGTREF